MATHSNVLAWRIPGMREPGGLQSMGSQRVRHDGNDFSSVQSLSRVRLFVTPWTAARQASLSITNSRSFLKLMSMESVVPGNHLILCRPLLLQPSNLSQHQGLFQGVGSSHQVAKVVELQLQHQKRFFF